MPTPTYIPLQTITLASAASSVTFASIPQTYRDLVLVVAGSSIPLYYLRVNEDSGSNYNAIGMKARSNGVFSYTDSNFPQIYVNGNPGGWLDSQIQLLDYSATDKQKSMIIRNGNYDGILSSITAVAIAARWANTNAVTSILVSTNSSTFAVGATFSLYAIEA